MKKSLSEITNKKRCYEFYEAGCFGNKALTWSSYEELIQDGWKGEVCMRSKQGIDRINTRYNLSLNQIPAEIASWKKLGIPEAMIAFNQSMPDEHLIIQGEVTRFNVLTLRYSTVKKPMNHAFEEENIEVTGSPAWHLLKKHLDYFSYENLEHLMEIWQDHVVEFSAYDILIGDLDWNTVFWEVRNY